MITYPPTLSSAPIRSLAGGLGSFSSSLQQGAANLSRTAQSVPASWTGKAAGAFQASLGERSTTISSTAATFASAATPLQTFAAAIDTTRAQHQAGVALEIKGYALLSNPYTAAAGEALIAQGTAIQAAAIAAVQAAGVACAGALAGIEAKIAAALFLGVDPQQFESVRNSITSVWGSVSSVFGGADGTVPDQSTTDAKAAALRAEQALADVFGAARPADMSMSGGSAYTADDLTVYADAPPWMPTIGTAGALDQPDAAAHGGDPTWMPGIGTVQASGRDTFDLAGHTIGVSGTLSTGTVKLGNPSTPSFAHTPAYELDPNGVSAGGTFTDLGGGAWRADGAAGSGLRFDERFGSNVTVDGVPVLEGSARLSGSFGVLGAGQATSTIDGHAAGANMSAIGMAGGHLNLETETSVGSLWRSTSTSRVYAGGVVEGSTENFLGRNADGNYEWNVHAGGSAGLLTADTVQTNEYLGGLVKVTTGVSGGVGGTGASGGFRLVGGPTEVGGNLALGGELGVGGVGGEIGLSVNPTRAAEIARDYVVQPLSHAGDQLGHAYDGAVDHVSRSFDDIAEWWNGPSGSTPPPGSATTNHSGFSGGSGGGSGGAGASGSW